jgi:hypothetical protein
VRLNGDDDDFLMWMIMGGIVTVLTTFLNGIIMGL